MKNLVSKILPLVQKLKGKKKIVVILSAVAIAAYLFAVQKGYLAEGAIDLEGFLDQINSAFVDSVPAAPVDSFALPIDTLEVEVVDSIIVN